MKLVIVGGVAGGASAAARARRLSEDAEIVLFERGPDLSFANCGLPYYIGGEIRPRRAARRPARCFATGSAWMSVPEPRSRRSTGPEGRPCQVLATAGSTRSRTTG